MICGVWSWFFLVLICFFSLPLGAGAQGFSCIRVGRIDLEGVRLLDEVALQRSLERRLGCVGLEGLDAILQEVTLAYVDAGYVASRAYLPEQDIGDGSLTVKVIEGVVSAIDLRIKGGAARHEAVAVFPGMVGGPLYIRDIEQGLDQLNRLPGIKATSELDAGAATGETVWCHLNSASQHAEQP